MQKHWKSYWSFFTGLALSIGGGSAIAQGKVDRAKVFGSHLEGNLLGETDAPFVSIYLPPSYMTEPDRRFPVVYFLHGYLGTDLDYFGDAEDAEDGRHLPSIADRVFGSRAAREMILVMPNCDNVYMGCMYANSATTGYWQDYISTDLVAYVDAHYRTIPERSSRGLTGHSMGGYGALVIGMKRSAVFSAIYALSSCCLDEFSPSGGEAARDLEDMRPKDAADNFAAALLFSRAAAWAPNPDNPPFFFDMPTSNGEVKPAIAARWAANSPAALLPSYVPSLKSLTAISLDVGARDLLVDSNRAFSKAMVSYDIVHEFTVYEGDHTSGVALRLEFEVLPFFSEHLEFRDL